MISFHGVRLLDIIKRLSASYPQPPAPSPIICSAQISIVVCKVWSHRLLRILRITLQHYITLLTTLHYNLLNVYLLWHIPAIGLSKIVAYFTFSQGGEGKGRGEMGFKHKHSTEKTLKTYTLPLLSYCYPLDCG